MQQQAAPDVGTGRRDVGLQLLCVDVAGHRCALPVEDVVEIHAAVQLTSLAGAPVQVAGVINRRGRPVPVLDGRRLLGAVTRPLRVDDCLVVVRLREREVALLVDAALEVLDVPATAIDEAVATGNDAALSRGVVVLPDGLLVVLDVAAFLSSDDVSTLDEALRHTLQTSA